MSLIFRMLAILFTSMFKPRLPIERPVNALRLRVLPNDLDINFHMNNGRYLTICDLTRVDMFIRTGLARTMIKEKWIPVIAEHTMTYKRPLKPLQRYTVSMEVTSWDEKAFHMKHLFMVGDKLMAEGTSQGVILSKQGVIPPFTVMERVNFHRFGTNESV